MARQNASFPNTKSFTRREVVTRVLPAGLAATMLGIGAAPAAIPVSAHTLQKSSPEVFWTNLAPGAAGYGDYTMVTSVSTDGRIFYNWWKLGEGEQPQWREIDGNGRTNAPAIASFVESGDIGIELDMWSAIKGLDDNIYMNQGGGFGRPFAGWVQLSGLQSYVAPAATVTNNGINPVGTYYPTVFATSTDNRICYYDFYSGTWTEFDARGNSNASPAVAVVGNDYFFIAMKGFNGQIYGNQGYLGRPVGWVSTGFSSNLAPAMASSGNITALVAVSTDGRIFYNWWKLGEGSRGWQELDGGGHTDAVPAAALVGPNNDYLFVVVKGREGRLWLNQGNLGRPFVGWQLMS